MAGARSTALQFRYLAVTDATGLRMIDVTVPERARIRLELLAGLTDWLTGAHPDSLRAQVGRSFRDIIDRVCPEEAD